MPPAEAGYLRDAFTPRWLAAQRWFRAKRRPIRATAFEDVASLDAAHASLAVLHVEYSDGGDDRYLVLIRDGPDAREPLGGEGAWGVLAGHMARGAVLRGRRGRFEAVPSEALEEVVPSASIAVAALDERRLAVEQSNTSVVLGERLILKLYRLVEPGPNPELEMATFLAASGFDETPALCATLRRVPDDGDPAAAAMLQVYVASSGDAWGRLIGLLEGGAADAVALAARIGALTARLHAALSSRPDDADFPARAATPNERAAWQAAAEAQLNAALAAVEGRNRSRLHDLAPAIAERFEAIGAADGARLSRIHGDYHLGQLLVAPDERLLVIDFEGEPGRSVAERSRPSSPLRDVAGMLRSLDYATRSVRMDAADGLAAELRSAFLDGYGGVPAGDYDVLRAFELEKACYEVAYEANNRPAWLWLPLRALADLTQ
jgi:maltokinase